MPIQNCVFQRSIAPSVFRVYICSMKNKKLCKRTLVLEACNVQCIICSACRIFVLKSLCAVCSAVSAPDLKELHTKMCTFSLPPEPHRAVSGRLRVGFRGQSPPGCGGVGLSRVTVVSDGNLTSRHPCHVRAVGPA